MGKTWEMVTDEFVDIALTVAFVCINGDEGGVGKHELRGQWTDTSVIRGEEGAKQLNIVVGGDTSLNCLHRMGNALKAILLVLNHCGTMSQQTHVNIPEQSKVMDHILST